MSKEIISLECIKYFWKVANNTNGPEDLNRVIMNGKIITSLQEILDPQLVLKTMAPSQVSSQEKSFNHVMSAYK